jgi:cell division protein FtsB
MVVPASGGNGIMVTRQRRQSRLNRLWMPLITAAFLGYFGFHAFNGYYGIWAMDRLEAEAERLATELEVLKRDHAEYERRAALLRTDNLDADIVDVEARTALNRLRADEIVVRTGEFQQNAQ